MCSAGCRIMCRSEDCGVHSRKFPSRRSSYKGAPSLASSLRCSLDSHDAPAGQRWEGACATGRLSAKRRFLGRADEWPRPPRFRSKKIRTQSDGTPRYSLGSVIPTLQRRRCTGGLCRTTQLPNYRPTTADPPFRYKIGTTEREKKRYAAL